MNIQEVIHFFTQKENIASILQVLGAVYTIAFFIVKLTPTQKDDEILGKLYGLLHKAIGVLGIKK